MSLFDIPKFNNIFWFDFVCFRNNKVNKSQIDKLVNFMVEHPNLARGTYCNTAEGRNDSCRQWDDLKNQLNALGPPTKTISEWRRVSRNNLNFVFVQVKLK